MTTTGPGPGWFADPAGSGGVRYFDGTAWTDHVAPPPPPVAPPPYAPWAPLWKGAQLGRPHTGPGALAEPGRRLAAQLLDGVLLLGVFAVFCAITIPIVAPHVGPILPKATSNPDAPQPVPGIVWLYVAVAGCGLLTLFVSIAYETVATTRYGRTLGKRWLHIRPLRVDGTAVTGWRALARSATRAGLSVLSWIGLLDPLWCLWDDKRQCLHDKVADTIVVDDPSPGEQPASAAPGVWPVAPPSWPA